MEEKLETLIPQSDSEAGAPSNSGPQRIIRKLVRFGDEAGI